MQIARVVGAKDQAGGTHKVQRNVQKIPLKTGSPIESHAATVLTPYAFSKLQEELVLAPQYASLMVDDSYFIVRHHTEMDGGYKVLWVPHEEFISCSCHNFEFTGILCRHVLRVLSTNNCFHIPDQYLPMRWRECSSSLAKPAIFSLPSDNTGKIQLLHSMISTLITESVETEERLNVVCDEVSTVLSRIKGFPTASTGGNAIAYESPSDSLILAEVEDSDGIGQSFACNPHEYINLEKLKERGSRDGLDLYRKRGHLSVLCCGQYGHDASDCPMMEGEDLNGDRLGFL